MIDILGIYWAGIERFFWFPIFILMAFFIIKNYVRIRSASRQLVHASHMKTIFRHFSLHNYFTKTVLLVTSVALVFLALLQPQWGSKEQAVTQESRDLVIVLDVSRSMLAQDFKPNRLEFAKLKIRSLLSKLSIERVGLVLFSGSAFVQCPLTRDHAAFLTFLNHVSTELISSGTTALDRALDVAMNVYEQAQGKKTKLVLLITDGEDFSHRLADVKQRAKKAGVTVCALGIGTEAGAPIPVLDNRGIQIGHEKDNQGNIVLSMLNETLLKQVTSDLGGSYTRARHDDGDVDILVNAVQQFEKEAFTDQKISLYEEQYPWILGLAFLVLLLEWVI